MHAYLRLYFWMSSQNSHIFANATFVTYYVYLAKEILKQEKQHRACIDGSYYTKCKSSSQSYIYIYTSIYKRLEASDNHTIYLSHWISKLLRILNIIYVWRLNHTVLELDFRAVKFLFFPRRDLNPHHWYTAAPFAKRMVPWEWMWSSGLGRWT